MSPAAKASWASAALALVALLSFAVFQVANQMASFEVSRQGVLTGLLPRTALWMMFAGEALAVVVGVVSLMLIRKKDMHSKAVIGIVARSLCGIVVGLCVGLILYLVVGHVVIGF